MAVKIRGAWEDRMESLRREPAQVAMARRAAALRKQNEERQRQRQPRPPESPRRERARRPRSQEGSRTEASDDESADNGEEPDSLPVAERRPRRLLRLAEVRRRTGFGKSKLYDLIAKREFPPPVPIGRRAVGWLEHEIDGWIKQRVDERDAGTAERNLPLAEAKAEAGRQRAVARRRKAAARRAKQIGERRPISAVAAEKAALEHRRAAQSKPPRERRR
jgi:prophage regulatory protein